MYETNIKNKHRIDFSQNVHMADLLNAPKRGLGSTVQNLLLTYISPIVDTCLPTKIMTALNSKI